MLKKLSSTKLKRDSTPKAPRIKYHVRFTESVLKGQRSEASTIMYDPYSDRKIEHPITNAETFFHLLKAALGTGVLAMPNAFYKAGWIIAIIGVPIIGIICTYCVHLLIKCQYEIAKRKTAPLMDYPSTATAALMEGPKLFQFVAPAMGILVNFFLLMYQIGTCCVYVVFIASNLKEVVDPYFAKPLDVRIYMAMIFLPVILLNYLRNLKYLAPFSTIAIFITIISFGITFTYVLKDLPDISERQSLGHIRDLPLFFGIVLFSLEAIGVILPLENNMETPRAFGGMFGILNRAMLMLVVIYCLIGFFGYLRYGEETKGSITLNIPQNDKLAQSVKVMISCSVFVSYALQFYVAIDIIWNQCLAKKCEPGCKQLFWEYVVRTCIVMLTFSLAAAIPNIELFISLVGALCVSMLALVFPSLLETSVFWNQKKGCSFAFMFVKNLFITLFGLFGLAVGFSISLKDIIEKVF